MSRRSVALLSVLLSCVAATEARAQTGARIVGERTLASGAIELTIATPSLAAPTRVQVFLPAGYDADPARRWPVTYYLHGAQGDETRFFAWYGDLIKGFPGIFVAPDGGQAGFYSDWFNDGAGGPPKYEAYDIDELMPLIDERFRTIPGRAGHALIGESMGGYGVMTFAARHPDLFAAAISMSGFLDTNTDAGQALITAAPSIQGAAPNSIYGPRLTQEVRWRAHNPTDLAGNLRGPDLQVRTAEGAPTTTIEGTDPSSAVGCAEENRVYETNRNFEARLVALHVAHLYKDYGAGCHSLPNFRREFKDSLPGLAHAFEAPPLPPREVDYASIEPSFSVWGWSVRADPSRALESLALRDAGPSGLTVVGSGRTSIASPPYFAGLAAVDVAVDGRTQTLTPSGDGRLHFDIDLGPAHSAQQYTDASRAAGDGTAGYFTSRSVAFRPHAALLFTRVRLRHRDVRTCLRAIGTDVPRLRLRVVAGGRTLASRRLAVGTATRCVRLGRPTTPRRTALTLQARGVDRFGHPVTSRRRLTTRG